MKYSSIAFKVIVLIVALVGIGGSTTAYIVYKSSSNALQSSISNNQFATAVQTADKLDRFMYERETEIEAASSWQQVKDIVSTPNAGSSVKFAAQQSLQSIKNVTASWDEVNVFNNSGHLLASSELNQPTSQIDPEIAADFRRAAGGEMVYSDAFLSADTKAPTVVFMVPVRISNANGQTVGVLEGELAWPTVLEILQSISHGNSSLMNSKGMFLGNNSSDDVQPGILTKSYASSTVFKTASRESSGSSVLPGLTSKSPFVTSFVKESGYLDYKGNGWLLVLETPKSVAYGSAEKLAKSLVVIYFLILIVSILIFLAGLNRMILRPIRGLSEAVHRIATGDYSRAVDIRSGDELGELGTGFNHMADKLQQAYGSLKESVNIAQEEKRLLSTLLENLPVGVLVVKVSDKTLVMANKAADEMDGSTSGKRSANMPYADFYNIVKDDGTPYPVEERPLAISIKNGEPCLKEDMYISRKDGTLVAIRAVATPIKQKKGETELAVVVFEDISLERNLERSREEFFSIASHELRTPLTAIRGNSSLIQSYYAKQLSDPALKEMVNDIHESSTRLIAIVNDFLDTSRLEQNRMKYEMEPLDMAEISKSVIKEYNVTGSRQKIHLEVVHTDFDLPKVMADRNRTKQILINLVGNALKFTKHGSVNISFEVVGGFLKTLVSDTGNGISPESQKFLFKKFEQSGSTVLTRDSVRGTGLGLYISKMITEQMHGHVKLESSKLGKGTVFSFTLPITEQDVSDNQESSKHSLPPTTRPPM